MKRRKLKGVGLMDCKYCGKQMELDWWEGISYSESLPYTCECGAQMTRFKNGREDFWYEPDIVDELGGIHGGGVGWRPDGTFCGECSRSSCLGCPNIK